MRAIGIDIGKVSFKAVLLKEASGGIKVEDTFFIPHRQEIKETWEKLKKRWKITGKERIAVTGRFRNSLPFPSIVEKAAQEKAAGFLYPDRDLTLIRLGGGGFSVLNLSRESISEYSLNPRCASGVGSFLDQIMSRIDSDIVKADRLASGSAAADITKRCGVTMKTDFTHLLNAGRNVEEVVAGLLEASAKSALELAAKKGFKPLVVLIGGLSKLERIQQTVKNNIPTGSELKIPENSFCFEALGAGLEAYSLKSFPEKNIDEPDLHPLKFLPPLKKYLKKVTRYQDTPVKKRDKKSYAVAGLDIGSTGSKLVVLRDKTLFEAYTQTGGRPVEAARKLLSQIPEEIFDSVKAVGITGSGRDIVSGALKASLASRERERIFVLNEIAAHAAGAHYYDPEVDTVADIGGQDAKYTRLESGRVTDSCMNTVCSAGTGSFLAEQLAALGIEDVKEFGETALKAEKAVDLGQHCAVFISEQIDEAKRRGAKTPEIVAGLYYSIIHNYDNRVKGSRDYGRKIFLQGKPATNLALAAAMAAVSGRDITVPPSPGTPGALGIAVLAQRELGEEPVNSKALNLKKFLKSRITKRSSFRCRSRDGCLEGNLCPIQQIKIVSDKNEKTFLWGGACDKFESGPAVNNKIARAPDPFARREKLIKNYLEDSGKGGETVGIPRGLETEEIIPFSATFFRELGFRVKIAANYSGNPLEKGARLCESTFCAPIQLLAGEAKILEKENFVYLPKIIEISGGTPGREKGRTYACPLSQAAPDMFKPRLKAHALCPELNLKKGLRPNLKQFLKLSSVLKRSPAKIKKAFRAAVKEQESFDFKSMQSGKEALDFARKNRIPAVVLLGHPYIINSARLAAGTPEAVRQSGALAIPVSSYPLQPGNGRFSSLFWGYGRRLMKAARQIRRSEGVYPLWLSVYSCGPDSFLIHFFQYISRGKPYAILESDAYTGQAGFKTRVEAFIYGINNYSPSTDRDMADFNSFNALHPLYEAGKKGRKVLIPRMGETSLVAESVFKSLGIDAAALPADKRENLETGRKYTSGKECLPMIITLGALLNYLKEHKGRFYYMMPGADGPCRFGNYHLLIKMALKEANMEDRVKVVSPTSVSGYGSHISAASMAKSWAGTVFADILRDALLDIRPQEKIKGEAEKVYKSGLEKMKKILCRPADGWGGLFNLWGIKELARESAEKFKNIALDEKKKDKPVVLVTGEIFLRLNRFSNNNVIRELESLGVKAKLAPFREWINYVNWLRAEGLSQHKPGFLKMKLTTLLQRKIENKIYTIFASALGWPPDHPVKEILREAESSLSGLKPLGEAALTIGLPSLLWKKKEIDACLIVGPFECMPSRIGETQLKRLARKKGLPVLALSFHGEAPDRDILEGFTHFL